jgi:hypothetical protein
MLPTMPPQVRPDLPPMPPRVAALPVDARGYPVPWFVAWIDGKPEFRAADGTKLPLALSKRLCWVCGDPLGVWNVFVIGPMCTVNRVSAEPPCHMDCAEFSVKGCPFLSKPHMVRRENDLPENTTHAGEMIRRNPGVSCLWPTKTFRPFRDPNGGVLFRLGDPGSVSWWAEGRAATRAEVEASVASGLPLLREMAEAESPEAVAELGRMAGAARQLLPRGAAP